ncbi:MAG: DMT family transporter [Firmicutes bacterium]|nr:DMT family transporter [Bacillota bacterium]
MTKNSATIIILISGVLWGTTSIFVKCMTPLGFSPAQIGIIRCVFSAAIMFCLILIRRPSALKICLRDIWIFIGTGLISNSLFNLCYFTTIARSEASIAVGLLYTSPIFVTVISAIVFKDKITKAKIIAVISTMVGCILLSGILSNSGGMTIGIFMVGIGAGFFYGLYSIFGRFAVKDYSPLTITFYTFLFAAFGSIPYSNVPSIPGIITASPQLILWGIGIAIIGTIGPYVLYTIGLKYIESSKAAVFATMEPLTASLIGIFMFHEPVTTLKIIGILLIMLSTVILNITPPPIMIRRKKRSSH